MTDDGALPTGSPYPIQSDEHALLAGMVWGLAMRQGLDLVPELDERGNYSASVVLRLPDDIDPGVTVRLIVEPPAQQTPYVPRPVRQPTWLVEDDDGVHIVDRD